MGADFLQVFSYFLANVSDFAHPWAYRLHCHSCMSPYLEDQFQFISHLYRRPLAFSEKCDHGQFDWRYIATKNCSDACVTLRMNDRVGGRRRFGFMRGCLSDIIHHNRTAVRFGELGRTTKSGATICSAIRLRDLFISSDRYAFDPHDHIELCACIRSNCNSARPKFCTKNAFLATIATFLTFLFLCDGETFPSVPKELPEGPKSA
uniref:Protein quiver n=1 Tax=Globodera pallida TaxID=36090 RepID=A0A183CCV8_GLOPA